MKRKSDSQLYIGITIDRRLKQRLGDHRRSNNFKNDDFTYTIIESSKDRSYIENREEYWIKYYDSFNNGLNGSYSGKGYGHNSSNFTTLGYKFTDEQRKNMSISARKRVLIEGFHKRSELSKLGWKNGGEKYRKHQSNIRKGKRLRKPKLSDNQIDQIRVHYKTVLPEIECIVKEINNKKLLKNPSWKLTTTHGYFGKKYHKKYNCSYKLLTDIVSWKTRTKPLPMI